jgi:hypothetical protein
VTGDCVMMMDVLGFLSFFACVLLAHCLSARGGQSDG